MSGAAALGLKKQEWWLLIGFVLLCFLGLWLLQPILMPFVAGALLAYLGDPLVDRLEDWGLGRSPAVMTVFLALTLFSALVLLLAFPLLAEQAQLLLIKLREVLLWLRNEALPEARETLGLASPIESAREALAENWMSAGGLVGNLWNRITGSGMALSTWLANLALMPIVTFYLLRDWDILMAKFRALLPRRLEPGVVLIASECDEIIGAFLRGQLIVMLCLGLMYSIGLWMIGLDLALVLGALAGLAAIVPYLGTIVGISAAGVAAWFQFGDWQVLLWVGLVFSIGQMVEAWFLTPNLVGERIGLHPVAVIFAMMAGGQLFGFVGILVALPVAAVLAVCLRHALVAYKDSRLYSTRHPAVELPAADDSPSSDSLPSEAESDSSQP